MQPAGGMPGPPVPPPYGYYYAPPEWRPRPTPRPRGLPNRQLFVIGAVGHFFAAGAVIAFALAGFGGFGFLYYGSGSSLFAVAASVVFFSAVLLHLLGFLGLWRNYGTAMGAVCFGFGIAPAIMPFLAVALGLSRLNYASYLLTFMLLLVSTVLLGVLFILEGVAYLGVRYFTSNVGLSVAAGVMFIVGGAFVCSVLLGFVGYLILVAPLIMGGVLLVLAPVPFVGGIPPPGSLAAPPVRPP